MGAAGLVIAGTICTILLWIGPIPVYGPYTVQESTCSGGECRITLDTGKRATIYYVVVPGDCVVHLPKSLPKWWTCDMLDRGPYDMKGKGD